MRFTGVIFSAAVATAAVIPQQGTQALAEVRPVRPELSDLLVNSNPADAEKQWEAIVPELEHVGLAKREAGSNKPGYDYVQGAVGGKGRGCKGIECHRQQFKEDHHDEYSNHHEHDHDGYEEHYWIEHIDNHHHHQDHRNHHNEGYHHDNHNDHHHYEHYPPVNTTKHKGHGHSKRDDVLEPVALSSGSSSSPPYYSSGSSGDEDRHHDYHRHDRHEDSFDDVEYFREEIDRDHGEQYHRNHHHEHGEHCDGCHHGHHERWPQPKHHKKKQDKIITRAPAAEEKAEGKVKEEEFHQGLSEKQICQYLHGIAYKAHSLQRPVEQFQHENVPWLTHNQGPWQAVLNGLRQIDWVLAKLGDSLKQTTVFTDKEEKQLVGCWFSFVGIKSPNGDSGVPFKKLLSLLTDKAKIAKHEPYAQSRVYNVIKNLEATTKSTSEQLSRVLRNDKFKGNLVHDLTSDDGLCPHFNRVLSAYEVQ